MTLRCSWKKIRNGLILLGIFSLLGCFSTLQFWFFLSMHGDPVPISTIIFNAMVQWYLWALLTPVLGWITRIYPIRAASFGRDIQINLLFTCIIVLGKILVDESMDFAFFTMPDRTEPFWERFFISLISPKSFVYCLIYWSIMAVYYTLHYNKQLRDREIAASQLEAQLAQAQLDALKMQLQPHFLFNTLNSISSLIRLNVDAADDMITNLSDMLRYSLNNINIQEVTLREEMEFLHRYLDIEKIRFQDRLQTEIRVDPSVMKARIPSMLLQPIVENSIRHGISKQAAPGKVSIEAKRYDNNLEMTVMDTGAGFSENQNEEGIGLSNTRKRLDKMYNSSYSFHVERSPKNETIVKITIPYTEFKKK